MRQSDQIEVAAQDAAHRLPVEMNRGSLTQPGVRIWTKDSCTCTCTRTRSCERKS